MARPQIQMSFLTRIIRLVIGVLLIVPSIAMAYLFFAIGSWGLKEPGPFHYTTGKVIGVKDTGYPAGADVSVRFTAEDGREYTRATQLSKAVHPGDTLPICYSNPQNDPISIKSWRDEQRTTVIGFSIFILISLIPCIGGVILIWPALFHVNKNEVGIGAAIAEALGDRIREQRGQDAASKRDK